MKKINIKTLIWVGVVLFVAIGLAASINQIPPKNTINRFDLHPIQTLFHVVPAIIFLLIGVVNLIPKVRKKYPKVHKYLGWLFVVMTISIGITSLTIVFTFPYAGFLEQIPITIFAILLLFFLFRGIRLARQKKFVAHRKDLIRVYSLGLGASMFRIQIIPLAIMGFDAHLIVPFIFWASFGGMLLLAELYFWYQSKKSLPLSSQLV